MEEQLTRPYEILHRKGDEYYIFTWHPRQTPELFAVLGRWASDPKLTFNWQDMIEVVNKMNRKMGVM